MVSRIPPPEDGSPARPQRTTGALALLLVLAVAAGVWLLSGRDPGSGTSVVTDDASTSAPARSPEPSPEQSPGQAPTDPTSGSPTAAPEAGSTPSLLPAESGTAGPSDTPTIDPDSGLPTVYLLDLPPEAAETVEVIDRGPPFPYSQDGGTFGNYEALLPDADRGYYQEFTVETPGSYDRGARRIIEGGDGELYWTDDHYASFFRILL